MQAWKNCFAFFVDSLSLSSTSFSNISVEKNVLVLKRMIPFFTLLLVEILFIVMKLVSIWLYLWGRLVTDQPLLQKWILKSCLLVLHASCSSLHMHIERNHCMDLPFYPSHWVNMKLKLRYKQISVWIICKVILVTNVVKIINILPVCIHSGLRQIFCWPVK